MRRIWTNKYTRHIELSWTYAIFLTYVTNVRCNQHNICLHLIHVIIILAVSETFRSLTYNLKTRTNIPKEILKKWFHSTTCTVMSLANLKPKPQNGVLIVFFLCFLNKLEVEPRKMNLGRKCDGPLLKWY